MQAEDAGVPIQPAPSGQTLPMPGLPAEPGVGAGRRGFAATLAWLRPLGHNRKAVAGATILLAFAAIALLAPVIAQYDPREIVARRHLAPSSEHWFGTTGAGQDVFSQTVWGARPTLAIALAVGVLTTALGALMGMTAGYFGGRVDDLLSLLTNVFLIIPALPLLVVLSAFLGRGNAAYLVLVLALTGWAWPARVLRSQTLSLRERDFVAAAEVSGERSFRIIFGEILPNMTSITVAGFFGSVIYAIGAQAALEFLGLGNPSRMSWGISLFWAQNNGGLLTGAWWTFVPAGTCIALVAFAFALCNYAIDELTNPRLRARREAANVLKQRSLRVAGTRATPVVRRAV
jgi:peptide/nickel transport system permease protein